MSSINAVAILETKVDYLETELSYLNNLLVKVGFPDGITSLKETALEILNDARSFINPYEA